MKGILYTGYFGTKSELPGKHIAICRYLPNWALLGRDYDDWWIDLAPSSSLLNKYKDGMIDSDEYTKTYLKEQSLNRDGLRKLKTALDSGETFTIMCREAPLDKCGNKVFCHRNILRKILVRNGYLALEYTTTTIPLEKHEEFNEFLTGDLDNIELPSICKREVESILKVSKLKHFITDNGDKFTIDKIIDFRIFVGGSRTISDMAFIYKTLDDIINKYGLNNRKYNVIIIQGDASGVDTIAKYYATERGYEHEDYPAKWDDINAPGAVIKYNKFTGKPYNVVAGFWRNEEMAKIANLMVLFHRNNSRGTADDKRLAKKYNIKLEYFVC